MKANRSQSLAGVIRERLASIEARLAVGIRQEVIVSELAAEGYETTLKNLRNELCRARKRKSEKLLSKPSEILKNQDQPIEESKVTTPPRPEKPPENPLKKPPGFNYTGTKGISEDDLI